MNEYEPWVEMGMTEAAYYKGRYVESRKDFAAVQEVVDAADGLLNIFRSMFCFSGQTPVIVAAIRLRTAVDAWRGLA